MPETRSGRGLLDTSVLVALDTSPYLPEEASISAITLAEVAAGPHATADPLERGRRQARLQLVEATFDPLPFDAASARAFGRAYAVVADGGRKVRGRRSVDLLIAATAIANDMALYTRNAEDLRGLESLLDVVDCSG